MKNKKIYIIIGCILLGLFIILSLMNEKNVVIDKDKYSLKISNDYNDYLAINILINDYLQDLSLNNQDGINGITS